MIVLVGFALGYGAIELLRQYEVGATLYRTRFFDRESFALEVGWTSQG